MAELLAIVIPTLGASADLPGALAQCDDAHKAGLASQTIVSDGGSADDTVAIARAAGADVVVGDPGRGGQLRRAAFLVSTPWMLVLHADTRLSPEWLEAVAGHVRNFPDAAGYFGLRFSNRSVAARTVAAGANLRARYLGLPYGDQGLLVPMTLYAAVGGYPDQPLMEDVEIANRLSGKLRELPATAITSSDRYRKNGWIRQSGSNLIRLARYKMGASPDVLATGYRKG